MWRRLIILLIPCLCFAAECTQIGVPTLPKIQGIVEDPQEKVQPGVTVEIYTTNTDGTVGPQFDTVTTNEEGRFSVKGKENRVYVLRLKAASRQYGDVRMKAGSKVMRRSPGFKNLLLTISGQECPSVSLAP